MITITNSTEITTALSTMPDATLKHILADRVEQLAEYDGYDLGELAHFLIVQPGDALDTIEAAVGFSLQGHPVEAITNYEGWQEACVIVSDDGFGWCILVPDHPSIPTELRQLCRGASELLRRR